jgi:hypothetical protein
MSYPSGKTHRVNRRKLGRGQYPTNVGVTVTATLSGEIVTMAFSMPVVVSGTIPLTVAGGTFVSQTINSPQSVSQTFTGTITTSTWSIPANAANVASHQGGTVQAAAGTF